LFSRLCVYFPSLIFKNLLKIRRQKHLHFCREVINLIKKPLGFVLTAVLTMGLAACNNDADNAASNDRTARIDRNNNIMNVGNGRDDGIDHNGPLTEDYTNNDNNDSDVDRGYNNHRNRVTNVNNNRNRNLNNDRVGLDNNQNRNRGLYNVNNDRDFDWNRDNKRANRINNNDMNISASRTTINSNKYPHTKAVLIQDAKYQFVRIDPRTGVRLQIGVPGQVPNQQQQIAQAPTQQQPATPAPAAPAPKPAAPATPAPAAPAPAPAAPAPAPKPAAPAPATGDVNSIVQQVIDLTNAQRTKNGLPALKADAQLNSVAQKKSVDMQQNNYFSHTSPTYGSPFDMMRDFGVSYKSAGENIAQGQRTPQEVVNAWMNSEGHRKNILSGNFTHIGVGYEKTGNHWTQMFIGK
jgi:uncharacterized YkwD family protein